VPDVPLFYLIKKNAGISKQYEKNKKSNSFPLKKNEFKGNRALNTQ